MNKKQVTELKKLLDEQEVINRKIGALEEQERIIKLITSDQGYEWLNRWIMIGDESDLVAFIRLEGKTEEEQKKIIENLIKGENTNTKQHCDDCNDFGCHGCSCADVEGYCGTCGKDDK